MMESSEAMPKSKDEGVYTVGKIYAFAVVIFTAGVMLLSLGFLFNPYWTAYYNLGGNVFFFVLLQLVSLGFAPFVLIIGLMIALYISFFYFMIRGSTSKVDRIVDSPAGYFAIIGPAIILVTLVISLIEAALGVGIGGSSIENQLFAAPFLGYTSLIYAPFAEEIGFRIIPLGIFSFVLTYTKSRNVRDSFYSIIAPGRMREKYDQKIGWVGIVLIFATSIIWGYAHVYYGAWDAGKMLTVAIAGVALAVGYLKFGVYVDIPMHWLSNGAITLASIYPLSVGVVYAYLLWLIVGGVAGLVMLIIYLDKYMSERKGRGIQASE